MWAHLVFIIFHHVSEVLIWFQHLTSLLLIIFILIFITPIIFHETSSRLRIFLQLPSCVSSYQCQSYSPVIFMFMPFPHVPPPFMLQMRGCAPSQITSLTSGWQKRRHLHNKAHHYLLSNKNSGATCGSSEEGTPA